jgi:UDP-glucose 4-epimerase
MQWSETPLLIFSSTAAVYGDDQSIYSETDKCNPVNPYGRSKLMAEQIIKDQCATGHLRAICLRYFNVYGGDYIDKTSANLHSVIERCKESQTPLIIHGNDFPTRDGTAVRDYIHVDDLSKAHVLALEYLINNPNVKFEIFNIGTQNGKTVLEVVEEAGGVEYRFGPRRNGDPTELISNCDKAKHILGWEPSRTT